MYFSSYGNTDWKISVARLDGAFRSVVLSRSKNEHQDMQPNSIAVHPTKGYVWSDQCELNTVVKGLEGWKRSRVRGLGSGPGQSDSYVT